MREFQRFTFVCLSVSLAAQLLDYVRFFGLLATASVVLLSVLLGGVIVPVLRASPALQLALMYVNVALGLIFLVAPTLQPAVASANLALSVVLWLSFFGGPGSGWRRRVRRWLRVVTRLAQPVIPLPS